MSSNLIFSDFAVQEALENLIAVTKGVQCILLEFAPDEDGGITYSSEARMLLGDALRNALNELRNAEREAYLRASMSERETEI